MTDPPSNDELTSLLSRIPRTEPEVIQAINDLRSEHSHYAAIGRVAAAWSFFEAIIDTRSIHLAKLTPEFGVCFTSQISGVARKLDAFISLARLHNIPQKLIRELHDFDKDAKSLSERRNRTIHDVWLFNHPNSPERLEASARKISKLKPIPVPTADLVILSIEINQHLDRFDDLASRVFAEHHASPKTPEKGTEP
jgi:hypothetical protein